MEATHARQLRDHNHSFSSFLLHHPSLVATAPPFPHHTSWAAPLAPTRWHGYTIHPFCTAQSGRMHTSRVCLLIHSPLHPKQYAQHTQLYTICQEMSFAHGRMFIPLHNRHSELYHTMTLNGQTSSGCPSTILLALEKGPGMQSTIPNDYRKRCSTYLVPPLMNTPLCPIGTLHESTIPDYVILFIAKFN